jgi:glycosyltransferase 2 family protein
MSMRQLRLAFTLVSIAALVWIASPVQLLAVIRTADPRWIATGIGLSLAATLLAAGVFQQILAVRGVSARFRAVLAANLAGELYALTLPGGLAVGGAVRLLRLGRDGQGMSAVFAALVASRLQEMLLQLSLAMAAMPWIVGRLQSPGIWAAALGLGMLAAGAGYVAVFNRAIRRRTLGLIARRLPRRSAATRRLRRLLLRAGRLRPVHPATHARVLALGALRHLLGAAAFLAFAAAAGAELGLAPALWARGITGIAMLLPLSVAGLGLREVSYVALLGLFGVAPPVALAISLMVFGCVLLSAAAGALIELRSAVRRPDAGAAANLS